MKKILVTGACGFVGTHLVEHILKNTDWEITVLDRLDTSGNPNRLSDMLATTKAVSADRVKFLFWDLRSELNDQIIKQLNGPFDYIAHLAAGSHVDRSIENPLLFFMDNCIGTVNLLNYARDHGLKSLTAKKYDDSKFLYFSTDEVFGPAPLAEGEEFADGFKEWDRLNPNNPYAAAKAAAEMAVIAYANTYQIPCVITNTMNIFGERQHPEKFIPLIIKKVLLGEKLFIHSNKERTQAGKRHYLHARNICAATLWVLQNGENLDGSAKKGRYNVVGEIELDNLALAQKVAAITNEWLLSKGLKELPFNYELVDFHSSRPGHDLRYALDGTHLKEAGFSYPVAFEDSLRKMIFWTLENKEQWL
jgi:dTDP-glucose 4,6-dehydratase